MAKKSIIVASVFGVIASIFVAFTGDEAAYTVARKQPMKLAAIEGLYQGDTNCSLCAIGVLRGDQQPGDTSNPYLFAIKLPGAFEVITARAFSSLDQLVAYGAPLLAPHGRIIAMKGPEGAREWREARVAREGWCCRNNFV